MGYVFTKKEVAANSNTASQREHESNQRRWYNSVENNFAANALSSNPLSPSFYSVLDRQSVAIMRDPQTDVLLRDLEPLARSFDIGVLVHQHKVANDTDDAVVTSLSGLEPIPHVGYGAQYDGAIIPVHQSGFYQEWRERAGKQGTDWDDWADQQAASVRSVRNRMCDYLYDGREDLSFKGVPAYGIRNGSNTNKAEIGVNLASEDTSSEQIFNAFRQMVFTAQYGGIIGADLTFYVSGEILQRLGAMWGGSGTNSGRTLFAVVSEIPGIAAIKRTPKLQDNEVIAGVLSTEFIQPLVGQAVSTVVFPRATPFSRYEAAVWSAMGIKIIADGNGRSGWTYFSANP